MQAVRPTRQEAALVGWGVRVLLLSPQDAQGAETTRRRLAGFGGLVERHTELFEALEALIEDPAGYGLFVMECDGFGGIQGAQKAFGMLGPVRARIPMIVVSGECREQVFPDDRSAPILLRAPLSAVALRVGFEHALRDRMMFRAA